MNEATLPNTVGPGRFFPLHLKFMLSYLVLAAAILGVSSAFAWREANDENARADTSRVDSSNRLVRSEYDRAMERALAVVNLAAVTPEMTAEIINRGSIELGPESTGTSNSTRYDVTARYLPPPASYLMELGIDPNISQPLTGAAIMDGHPVALAVSPVSSMQVANGFILVSVDLTNLPARIADSGQAYMVTVGKGGAMALAGPGAPPSQKLLPAADLDRLSAGSPVLIPAVEGDNTPATGLYPLPGASAWPLTAVAIEMTAEDGAAAAGRTNPLLGLAVLTISIGLFIAHFLARTMSRPVEKIMEATELVAAGDISYQLPHQKGRDELSLLGDSFNRMTQKYCSSQAEVETAAVRLEQTVVAQDAEIQTLFGISRAITSILDINYLLEQVLVLSMPLVDSQRGTVWLEKRATGVSAANEISDLMPAITIGGETGQPAEPLLADHGILSDLHKRNWKVSVLLPESAPGAGDQGRQLFFARETGSGQESPLRREDDRIVETLRLPVGIDDPSDTQVTVPVIGQKGFASGILAMTIAGRRELSEHEALLIFNIVGLASVAVENAGLFGLAQRRGEQIETLLRESHHRITNNLAAISGMLSIQLTRAGSLDAATVIRDNITRISSIAQVHRLLSGEMKDEVNVTQMIRTICAPIVSASPTAVELEVEGPALVLPATQATALALIANELATNSIKYAFPGRKQGNINISITAENDSVVVVYRDDGQGDAQSVSDGFQPVTGSLESSAPGLPAGGTKPGSGGLGVQIINSLVQDELGGQWQRLPGPGYAIRLRFPGKDINHQRAALIEE